MYTKNGDPTIAVIIPIESSELGIIVLAITSAQIINIDPRSIDIGVSLLWSDPTSDLVICGMINPTNPMIPQTETKTPVSREVIIIYNLL